MKLFNLLITFSIALETALLHVQNVILQSLDKKQPVILVFLDLSAAFDNVSHEILESGLATMTRFGIRGTVPKLFESYLPSRT